ncbi:rab-GTPase-TBC domain-containing protein [Pelagophyceae sp. CCMP2097]|nr:rab-GTPase-TBC domain-containing protein [Pelagophyceae sp. CCMP2097]
MDQGGDACAVTPATADGPEDWTAALTKQDGPCLKSVAALAARGAAPAHLRAVVWAALLGVGEGLSVEQALLQLEGVADAVDAVECDLANQKVVAGDVARTRGDDPRFDARVRRDMARMLTLFCKRHRGHYRQGLNEVLAPFVDVALQEADHERALQRDAADGAADGETEDGGETDGATARDDGVETDGAALDDGAAPDEEAAPLVKEALTKENLGRCYESFSAFVAGYLRGFYIHDEADSASLELCIAVFANLLRYHEPALARRLGDLSLAPELFVTPWVLTCGARPLGDDALRAFWQLLLVRRDALLNLFVALAIVRRGAAALMAKDEGDLPAALTGLFAACAAAAPEDVFELTAAADALRAGTPGSVTRLLREACCVSPPATLFAAHCAALRETREAMRSWSCVGVAADELAAALAATLDHRAPDSQPGHLQYIVLDVRGRDAFEACRFARAFHLDPILLDDAVGEATEAAFDVLESLRGCHVILVGDARKKGRLSLFASALTASARRASLLPADDADAAAADAFPGEAHEPPPSTEESDVVARFAALLLRRGYPRVSHLRGGFAACVQALRKLSLDRDPESEPDLADLVVGDRRCADKLQAIFRAAPPRAGSAQAKTSEKTLRSQASAAALASIGRFASFGSRTAAPSSPVLTSTRVLAPPPVATDDAADAEAEADAVGSEKSAPVGSEKSTPSKESASSYAGRFAAGFGGSSSSTFSRITSAPSTPDDADQAAASSVARFFSASPAAPAPASPAPAPEAAAAAPEAACIERPVVDDGVGVSLLQRVGGQAAGAQACGGQGTRGGRHRRRHRRALLAALRRHFQQA